LQAGSDVRAEDLSSCSAFNKNCMQFYFDDKPLMQAASLFNSRVGVGTGFGIAGIPGYNQVFNKEVPIKSFNLVECVTFEGSLGIGRNVGTDFGTWGAGVNNGLGVGDFYRQSQSVGANWYAGKYGVQNNYGVPLVPAASVVQGTNVCVSANTFRTQVPHKVQVDVPINEQDLGKPIQVNNGLGVGNWYAQNKGVGVDWLKGGVGVNNG
jgi:hypothetical protein